MQSNGLKPARRCIDLGPSAKWAQCESAASCRMAAGGQRFGCYSQFPFFLDVCRRPQCFKWRCAFLSTGFTMLITGQRPRHTLCLPSTWLPGDLRRPCNLMQFAFGLLATKVLRALTCSKAYLCTEVEFEQSLEKWLLHVHRVAVSHSHGQPEVPFERCRPWNCL